MKILNQTNNSVSDFVILQDQKWLDRQRIAGRVVANTLTLLENAVKENTTKSLIELNAMAEEYIENNGCSATFKNYKGFPAGVCISINRQLVHGIPTDYKLQDGDKISFDLGATYEGAIADSAITLIYGEPKSKKHAALAADTQQALYTGIKAISIGKKIGVIGNAIHKLLKDEYDVIVNYGGHGISYNKPHAQPFIANRSTPNDGVRIQAGMTIAIEPMATLRSTHFATKTSEDGWSVMTTEIGAHWEHSLYIHHDHIEIVTHRENEAINRDIYFQ